MAEQRDFTGVQFNFAGEIRATQRGDVLASQLKHFRVINQNFTDVLTQIITEGTHNDVAFLVDQERSRTAFSRFLDGFPVLQTEAQVPLQCFGRFADACGAHDKAHAVWQLKTCQRFFQLCTVITFDTARDATRTRVVWHQHQIASCQTDKGGQCGTFVATLFFIDLDDNFLTFTQNIFNVRTAMGVVVCRKIFAGDFFERKETVTLSTVIDKCSFKAWFNAGDFAFVNVRFFLFVSRTFDIQIVQALPIHKGDTQLFLLSCVD